MHSCSERPFCSSGGLDASATSFSPYASNQVANKDSAAASIQSSINLLTSLRLAADLFNCVSMKFSSDLLEQSSRYSKGGSGFITSSAGYCGRKRKVVSMVLNSYSNRNCQLRRKREQPCGTENAYPASVYQSKYGPMKAWSAKSSLPPTSRTEIFRANCFITLRSALSIPSSAKKRPIQSHVGTGARDEN